MDVNILKGHSTRAASTLVATISDLSLCEILERGSWSSASTWQRFYIKHIIPITVANFQNSISMKHKSLLNRSYCFEQTKEIWAPLRWSTVRRIQY